MIEFNLFVPPEDASEIAAKRSDEFVIITSSYNSISGGSNFSYFQIKGTEEEMAYLTLKYGPGRVWKR